MKTSSYLYYYIAMQQHEQAVSVEITDIFPSIDFRPAQIIQSN